MSLLPLQTIDTIRQHYSVVIDTYGIPCELYLPKNIEQQERLDIYNERPSLNYDVIDTKVFIEFQPNAKRLRKLGIFVEGQIPIIGWLKENEDIQRNSYIKVDIRNIPSGDWVAERYELVDRLVKSMYNSIIIEAWKLVPLREVPANEKSSS